MIDTSNRSWMEPAHIPETVKDDSWGFLDWVIWLFTLGHLFGLLSSSDDKPTTYDYQDRISPSLSSEVDRRARHTERTLGRSTAVARPTSTRSTLRQRAAAPKKTEATPASNLGSPSVSTPTMPTIPPVQAYANEKVSEIHTICTELDSAGVIRESRFNELTEWSRTVDSYFRVQDDSVAMHTVQPALAELNKRLEAREPFIRLNTATIKMNSRLRDLQSKSSISSRNLERFMNRFCKEVDSFVALDMNINGAYEAQQEYAKAGLAVLEEVDRLTVSCSSSTSTTGAKDRVRKVGSVTPKRRAVASTFSSTSSAPSQNLGPTDITTKWGKVNKRDMTPERIEAFQADVARMNPFAKGHIRPLAKALGVVI